MPGPQKAPPPTRRCPLAKQVLEKAAGPRPRAKWASRLKGRPKPVVPSGNHPRTLPTYAKPAPAATAGPSSARPLTTPKATRGAWQRQPPPRHPGLEPGSSFFAHRATRAFARTPPSPAGPPGPRNEADTLDPSKNQEAASGGQGLRPCTHLRFRAALQHATCLVCLERC
jgi:hypothetical protein